MQKFNPIAELFRCLAISVALMFIGFAIGQRFIPAEVVLLANVLIAFMLTTLIILAIFSRKKKKSDKPLKMKMSTVYLFTFIEGVLIYPIIEFYIADLGVGIVTNTLMGIVLFLFVAYQIAVRSEYDKIQKLFPALFVGLIALLIGCVITIFIPNMFSMFLISVIGIIVFGLFTIYDLSLVMEEIEKGNIKERNDLAVHVFNIFLDIVNLLLDILRLIWIFKD